MVNILVVDNYDSFVYNLVQYLGELGATLRVRRNDEVSIGEIEAMAPHAVLVQAKAYPGGGLYYTLDLDYPRIIDIFRRHGYRGALSLEMEGNAHPDEGVPAALAMLRAALAR